jgi:hypothetical protein
VTARLGLAALLCLAGLPDSAEHPGTYRLLKVTCPKCDLRARAMKLASPKAVPCGGANERRWEEVSNCISAARDSHRPFVALLKLQDLDSSVEVGLIGSASGNVDMLWYDSDPSGGCTRCNAVIWKSRCRQLDLQPAFSEACEEEEGSRFVLCSEASHRTITSGEPLDASNLFCPEEAFSLGRSARCSHSPGQELRTPQHDERVVCHDACGLRCSIRDDFAVPASYFEEAPGPVR